MGSESSLGRAVFLKSWDRGKLKTGEKRLGSGGSPGGPGQGAGGAAGLGKGPARAKWGGHPPPRVTLRCCGPIPGEQGAQECPRDNFRRGRTRGRTLFFQIR